ncbi:MAG: hypothetical protein ACI9LE_000629 [Paraglaciecola sp.]|jgi:hypothetical protein
MQIEKYSYNEKGAGKVQERSKKGADNVLEKLN